MSYVNLNAIQAGVATTLEESEWTSIQERLLAAAASGPSSPTNTPVVPAAAP